MITVSLRFATWRYRARSRDSSKNEKTPILDEFVSVTGFHRKHAIRLLKGEADSKVEGHSVHAPK